MDFHINNHNKKRIFIGLEIPEHIRAFYYSQLSGLKKTFDYIRLVKPANIHLTIQFIGNTYEEDIEKIKSSLQKSFYSTTSFVFRPKNNIQGFPSSKSSKIIYVGIEKGSEKIKELNCHVKKSLYFLNLKENNKDFTPHITLARTKKPINLRKLQLEVDLEKFEDVKCEKIIIFESVLSVNGAEYHTIDEICLKDC